MLVGQDSVNLSGLTFFEVGFVEPPFEVQAVSITFELIDSCPV